MKRKIALLPALAVLLSFCACGGSGEEAIPQTTGPRETAAEAAEML